jgi:hypothetical protein
MRGTHDRRRPRPASLFPADVDEGEVTGVNRRKRCERRMEKLTLEERQLLLSEMPAPPEKAD